MKIKTIYNADTYEVYTDEEIKEQLQEWQEISAEEITQEMIWEERNYLADRDYQCEQDSLDLTINNQILCIADLGLWTGRKSGYKALSNNLNSILSASVGDYYHLYYDGYNIRAKDSHHDGTNYYLFRELKTDTNYQILLDKLYSGTATQADINRYTKSLRPYVKEIYGW
jgi:hypothetical protein